MPKSRLILIHSDYKSLVKNFERTLAHDATKANLCFIHLMIKRLSPPLEISNRF